MYSIMVNGYRGPESGCNVIRAASYRKSESTYEIIYFDEVPVPNWLR